MWAGSLYRTVAVIMCELLATVDVVAASRSAGQRRRLPGHHLPAARPLGPHIREPAPHGSRATVHEDLEPHLAGEHGRRAEDLNRLVRPLRLAVDDLFGTEFLEIGVLAIDQRGGVRVHEV